MANGALAVPTLPEGLEFVRFGGAQNDGDLMYSDGQATVDTGSSGCVHVIVRVKPGWVNDYDSTLGRRGLRRLTLVEEFLRTTLGHGAELQREYVERKQRQAEEREEENAPRLPGLPEGVIPIRWGIPEQGQTYMTGPGDPVRYAQSHLAWRGAATLIVRLADGYHLRYNSATDRNEVRKSERRELSFVLVVNSEQEELDARAKLREMGVDV